MSAVAARVHSINDTTASAIDSLDIRIVVLEKPRLGEYPYPSDPLLSGIIEEMQ